MSENSFPRVPLKFISTIFSGGTPKAENSNWDGDVPFITPPDLNGLDGSVVETWGRTVTSKGAKSGSTTVQNAVLISCRAPVGHVGSVIGEVAFNQGCKAVSPNNPEDLSFIAKCLVADRKALQSASRGTTFTELSTTELSDHKIPWPSESERPLIADYLDRETGELNAMIDKLDELEETLQARKIELIQRETQLSANGEPWDTVPTAHLFETIGSGTTPKGDAYYTKSGEGVPWVTTSELRENVVQSTSQNVTEEAIASISSLTVHPKGAIVIAMYGATIGRLGILGVNAAMNQACCAFSSPRDVDSKFFYYTLWAQRDDIIRLAVGGGQPNISQNMLRRWKVPVPPLEEQRRIADHLDEVTAKIDTMLAKVAELKDLLAERRAALITDVVTGRKDVA